MSERWEHDQSEPQTYCELPDSSSGMKDIHPHQLPLVHLWSLTTWPFQFWNPALLP